MSNRCGQDSRASLPECYQIGANTHPRRVLFCRPRPSFSGGSREVQHVHPLSVKNRQVQPARRISVSS
jgi:hypothetical protein